MLKTSTGRIYTLLSACKPDNAKVKKRLLITKILEMPEYKALQVYQGAASVMDDYYGPVKLQTASYEELLQVEQIIPFLEDCIRRLYDVICYGDVRKLVSFTDINFYDASRLQALYQTVSREKQTGVNITNIPEYDIWSFFSENTIKSMDKVASMFETTDVNELEADIVSKLKDYPYCISAAEIAEKRQEYLSVYSKEETLRLRLQIVENKIFVKKLFFSFIALIIVIGEISHSSVAVHPVVRFLFFAVYMCALIAYWIKG